jgi:hypothetical protein
MPDAFNALTDAQRAAFERVMKNFGRSPADFTGQPALDTADFGGKLVIARDDESHVPAHMTPFTSMAHLKSLIGIPDEHYQNGAYSDVDIAYPQPLDAERAAFLREAKNIADFGARLSADEHRILGDSARAYLFGDSSKVANADDLLAAHFTPGTIAFFAAADVTVRHGHTLTISSPMPQPVVFNCGAIRVIGSGQIVVHGQATIIAQQFTCERVSGIAPNPQVITIQAFDGTPGTVGGSGAEGAKGTDADGGLAGHIWFLPQVYCLRGPSDGTAGALGGPGGVGGRGSNGVSAPVTSLSLGNVTGELSIMYSGGNGGQGGTGGAGGPGGAGGAATTVNSPCTGTANAGPQGPGGVGGPGGNGGNGADGTTVVLIANLNGASVTQNLQGGGAGAGGPGGAGGDGNPTGRGGDPGDPGQPGLTGTLVLRSPVGASGAL